MKQSIPLFYSLSTLCEREGSTYRVDYKLNVYRPQFTVLDLF